jgi:hypothetical protein
MKARLPVIAAAALAVCSGCVIDSEETVDAGEPLDADFTLTWEVVDARTESAVDCQLAGADTVRVRSHNTSTGEVVIDLFDCDAGAGTTVDLNAGIYSVSVALLDCRGDPSCKGADILSLTPSRKLYGVWDDGDYNLGDIVFQVRELALKEQAR